MRLSEYKNEEALGLLADIIDPATAIFADKQVRNSINSEYRLKTISLIMKNHSKEIIEILARLQGVPVSEYNASAVEMMSQVIELTKDEELRNFFTSLASTE